MNKILFALCLTLVGCHNSETPVTIVSDYLLCDESHNLIRELTFSNNTREIEIVEVDSDECGFKE
jgi:hypothetical protein